MHSAIALHVLVIRLGRPAGTSLCLVIAMDCEQIDFTDDRNQLVWSAPLARDFSGPSRFDGLELMD